MRPVTSKNFRQSWVKKKLTVWPIFVVILYLKIIPISQWFRQEDRRKFKEKIVAKRGAEKWCNGH